MIGRMICLEMGSASWIDKRNLNRLIFAEGRTPPVHVKMSEEAEEEEAEEAAAEEEEEPSGYCARYTGKICDGYLSNPSSVWFNISSDETGGWLNEQLVEGLWEEVIRTLDQPCQSAAKVTFKSQSQNNLQVSF